MRSTGGRLAACAAWVGRSPAPELMLVVTVAFVASLPLWRSALPVGYGGFFVQMAEQLAANGFVLPREVAFYGPGGTPFAYPPFGIYLMAVAVGPLGVPAMAYVRWFPVLASGAVTAAVYALGRRFTGSRWFAIVATLLVMTNLTILDYHTTVAGVVRGPALAFAAAGLWAGLRALAAPRLSRGLLATAAGLFALTLVSHLSYAVFFAASLSTFALVGGVGAGPPARRRGVVAAAILCGGVVLASPWWLAVVRHWGIAPFASAAGSHGGFGLPTALFSQGARLPIDVARGLAGTIERWSPALVPGLALAGFGLLLARRQWPIPAWAAVAYLGVGESERFLALVGGITAAVLLAAVADGTRSGTAVLPAVLVVGVCLATAAHGRYHTGSALSPELLETAKWLRERTPPGSRYLELTGSHDVGEWLPYLSGRTPAVAPWGSEWNGRRDRQLQLYATLVAGAGQQRPELLAPLCDLPEARADHLLVPAASSRLIGHFERSGWEEADRNGGYVVLRRPPRSAPARPGPGT